VVTLSSDSRPIIGRGPPLGLRFFVLAIISIAVIPMVLLLQKPKGKLEAVIAE